MGILDTVRGRNNSVAPDALAAEDHERKEGSPEAPPAYSNEKSERTSLEARGEHEVEQHPDEVTQNAETGVQKAEAAALVWSKKSLIAIYAWYVLKLVFCKSWNLVLTADWIGSGCHFSCWLWNSRSPVRPKWQHTRNSRKPRRLRQPIFLRRLLEA